MNCVCFQGGSTVAGGIFATLQSVGAAGLGTLGATGIFGTTAGTTVGMSTLFGDSCENE